MTLQKQVSYTTTNTYTTQNEFTSETKHVWLVFHGLGYLSKYFINYFSELNPTENFIIAPQAPSKYYQDKKFKYVGASWLTRENTDLEIENLLNYIDAVFDAEKPKVLPNFIVLGYSQGVSIATRWVARRKIECNHLILHSGAIPKELQPEDFDFMSPDTKVTYLYGNNDQYVTEAKKTEQELKGNNLFGKRLEIQVFKGVHEVNKEYFKELVKEK